MSPLLSRSPPFVHHYLFHIPSIILFHCIPSPHLSALSNPSIPCDLLYLPHSPPLTCAVTNTALPSDLYSSLTPLTSPLIYLTLPSYLLCSLSSPLTSLSLSLPDYFFMSYLICFAIYLQVTVKVIGTGRSN